MMQTLEKTLRNQLERTIKEARDIAELAAKSALEHLGVNEAKPWNHLTEQDRNLRRKLRAHGRQLGDSLNGEPEQTMDRLVEELAYQHWHRMLFARFLAENHLLMYPDQNSPVSVSLEECEELAKEEGASNGWELASRYASQMLPQIFRLDSPVFQLSLPPEHQLKLEHLLAGLPLEVFTASDSLGWSYQFWQSKRKEEINDSEVKIGSRELPAVTQLFTEPYMVSFLLDNSLGAWWANKALNESDWKTTQSEEELRDKASIPGVSLDYLRFVQEDNSQWRTASGNFENWPKDLSDFKMLDPCCGSGHFLVAILLMLVPMRMKIEKMTAREAIDAVLRENIHGLELDQRCVEIAAFALALTAWKYPNAEGYRVLPQLNIACSGLSISGTKDEWKKLSNGNHNLGIALDLMRNTFMEAPVLGSLINPSKNEATKLVRWEELSSALSKALKQERSEDEIEVAVVAKGLSKATALLIEKYHLVITNVPYLSRGKQCDVLKDFCERYYSESKSDLATVFLDRCLEFCAKGGTTSIVLPQNWLFLTSYKKFREKLLKNDTWHIVARLGEGAFHSSAAAGAFVALLCLSSKNLNYQLYGLNSSADEKRLISALEVSKPRTPSEKADNLMGREIKRLDQLKQLENPDARIVLEQNYNNLPLLSQFAQAFIGLHVGGWETFRRGFWEVQHVTNDWRFVQGSVDRSFYSGLNDVAYWVNNGNDHEKNPNARVQGKQAWGKLGIIVSPMRKLPFSLYLGGIFDNNTCVIISKKNSLLPALWCFCSSPKYNEEIRKIDQKLNVTNATLVKVPFDLEHWQKVAEENYSHGLPSPYSDDPTQWIFHGHPCGSVIWDDNKKWTAIGNLRTDNTVLQIAVARLLGYRWPAELDENMVLAKEQRAWVKRCEELLGHADKDGIVCLSPLLGEMSATDRLISLLANAYGESWSGNILSQLLKNVDHEGKTLDSWLREKFFTQHCQIFQHRPFIWHIWDGLGDGFSVLINCHKLDYKKLETLTYTYLGEWIKRQKQDIVKGLDGAQERLSAAEKLKEKLELILKGEAPYDIFVRWKPLEKQPIGWNPDMNDGVRINIRPFMSVADVRKKGAGILRDKPNINWNKDRGKDVESAPWFHLFKGERINDHHLKLEDKLVFKEEKND